MSVSTNLRTDTSTMYQYDYIPNQLQIEGGLSDNCQVILDITPQVYPYVARICPNQGHFLIWYTDEKEYPEITEHSRRAKIEDTQSISIPDPNKIEYAQALIYPYEDEIIIGTVKYYNYMRYLGNHGTRNLLKEVWRDIIRMFGNRKIICPTGTYFQVLHMALNQKRIPVSSYSDKIMKPMGFKHTDDFWIRDADLLD